MVEVHGPRGAPEGGVGRARERIARTERMETRFRMNYRTFLAHALVAAIVASGCAEAPAGADDGAAAGERLAAAAESAHHDAVIRGGGAEAIANVNENLYGIMSLSLRTFDARLAAEFPGYDGASERAFALAPVEKADGSLEWRRFDLPFKGVKGEGDAAYGLFHETMGAEAGLAPHVLDREGVAFGLDTNVGTLWLQAPGRNAPLHHGGYPYGDPFAP
jgi:hypothetical protein